MLGRILLQKRSYKQAYDMLLQMGAQYGQGYYFRSPYPMEGDSGPAPLYRPAVA